MTSYVELNKLDEKSLTKKAAELKKEVFELKFSKTTSGLEKSHILKQKKKEVARVLTALKSKGER